jgi:pyridoxamine 5'-phosphate oxidase
MTEPGALRRSYERGTLDDTDLPDHWLPLLQSWFEAAAADPEVVEPTAIQLATVDQHARPSVRTVLAKAIDDRGVVFYTNYDSAKAQDLAANNHAAAVFVWHPHQRQVRMSGPVSKVARVETERYFAGRPRESQIGAWASPQSQVVPSRSALDELAVEVERRFDGVDVPAPPGWGGYLLAPTAVEFWQGRRGRLHDRIRYRTEDGGTWVRERLAP